jgi:hypothetical protein
MHDNVSRNKDNTVADQLKYVPFDTSQILVWVSWLT